MRSLIASIGFWLCLLAAAGCYAAATLSSGIVENRQLADRHAREQRRIQHLMAQVSRYEKSVERLSGSGNLTGESPEVSRQMPVERSLQFRLDVAPKESGAALVPDWRESAIDRLGRSRAAHGLLLMCALTLLVIAFTCFQDKESSTPSGPVSRRNPRRLPRVGLKGLRDRYRASNDIERVEPLG